VVTTGLLELYVVQSSSQIITPNKPTSSFLQAGCPSCCPTNSVKALKGKISHSMDLLTPSSPGGVPTLCLWPLIAPGYLGGGLPCLLSALWCQYPNSEEIRRTEIYHSVLWHCLFGDRKGIRPVKLGVGLLVYDDLTGALHVL